MDPVKFGHDSFLYVYQPANIRNIPQRPVPTKTFEVQAPEKSEKSEKSKDKEQRIKDEKGKKKKGDEQKNPFQGRNPEEIAPIFQGEEQDIKTETDPESLADS